APGKLPTGTVEALPDHRRLVPGMTIADIGREVVAGGHIPAMRRAQLGVPIERAHRSFLSGRSHVAARRLVVLTIIEVDRRFTLIPWRPARNAVRTTRTVSASAEHAAPRSRLPRSARNARSSPCYS